MLKQAHRSDARRPASSPAEPRLLYTGTVYAGGSPLARRFIALSVLYNKLQHVPIGFLEKQKNGWNAVSFLAPVKVLIP